MTPLPVRYTVRARNDLAAIEHWIANEGSPTVAHDFVGRIVDFCDGLGTFPNRGVVRDGLQPGLRTIGFDRRATVIYRVRKGDVIIARVHYGGRDWLPRR